MAKPPVSEQVQVNFRMPADLRDRIKDAAERDGVSMNHLLIEALQEKYPAPVAPPLDIELATMTEWLEYIDSADSEEEFQNRLSEVNLRLRHSKSNSGFMIKVLDVEDGMPDRTLMIARAGFADPTAPMRYRGRTVSPTTPDE